MNNSFHVLGETILDEVRAVIGRIDNEAVEGLVRAILKAQRIFVTGEGRTGLLVRTFAMRLMQMGLEAYVIGETITPRIENNDLLIAVSGSGETATTLVVVESSHSVGRSLWAITASPNSRLAQLADDMIHIPGQTKERSARQTASMQPLSNLFAQALLITLDDIGLLVMQSRGEKAKSMRRRHGIL